MIQFDREGERKLQCLDYLSLPLSDYCWKWRKI